MRQGPFDPSPPARPLVPLPPAARLARRHPGQGREAAAEPGPIGRTIVGRGPVLALAHVRIVSQALNPAVLLNGSRLSLASLGRPG